MTRLMRVLEFIIPCLRWILVAGIVVLVIVFFGSGGLWLLEELND